jgi:hypothetical protein
MPVELIIALFTGARGRAVSIPLSSAIRFSISP